MSSGLSWPRVLGLTHGAGLRVVTDVRMRDIASATRSGSSLAPEIRAAARGRDACPRLTPPGAASAAAG